MSITHADEVTLADLNFAEMCRGITRAAGGRIHEIDGLLMWSGTHPSPALVNGLIRTRDERPSANEILDLADSWFAEVGHGYTMHVRVGRDDDLETAVKARGLMHMLDLPVMVYSGPVPEKQVPQGFTIDRVTNASGVSDLVTAVGEPFELPEEVASVFARPEAALSPFTAAMIARDQAGRPVSGAWTLVSHGVAGIGFVGTLESVRGRGLGTAVTWAAMRAGYEIGATRAALQASPMGRSVYARMGYAEVAMYRIFAGPAGGAH